MEDFEIKLIQQKRQKIFEMWYSSLEEYYKRLKNTPIWNRWARAKIFKHNLEYCTKACQAISQHLEHGDITVDQRIRGKKLLEEVEKYLEKYK